MDLTDTQHAILALIAERIARDGVPPSQTEIAHACGFKGVRAAQYHLEALEAAHPECFDPNSPSQRVGGAPIDAGPTVVTMRWIFE